MTCQVVLGSLFPRGTIPAPDPIASPSRSNERTPGKHSENWNMSYQISESLFKSSGPQSPTSDLAATFPNALVPAGPIALPLQANMGPRATSTHLFRPFPTPGTCPSNATSLVCQEDGVCLFSETSRPVECLSLGHIDFPFVDNNCVHYAILILQGWKRTVQYLSRARNMVGA